MTTSLPFKGHSTGITNVGAFTPSKEYLLAREKAYIMSSVTLKAAFLKIKYVLFLNFL